MEGAITLRSGSTLTGPVAAGPVANVEFTLETLSGEKIDDSETWFGFVMATGWRAGVSVSPVIIEKPTDKDAGTVQGDSGHSFELQITTTMIDTDSQKPVTSIVRKRQVPASSVGKWLVRYNHGVIETWRDGERLLSADCGWGDFGLSGVELSQRYGDIQLVHLRLAARDPVAGPQFNDRKDRQKLIEEWQEIAPKASELLGQRKLQEYLPVVQRQAVIEQQIFGATSLIPIKTGAQVALALELTDHRADAFEIYDRLLKASKEKLGSRHPQVAQLLISREFCRGKMKQFNGVPEEVPGDIGLLSEVLGEEHLITMLGMEGYISYLDSAGRVREAEQAALQMIARYENAEGVDSPGIVVALRDLTAIQQRMGKQQDEVKTLNRIVSIQTRTLGATHAETLQAREYLADGLRRSGDHGSARQTLEQNLQIQINEGGVGRSAAAKTSGLLADLSLDISDLDAAQIFAERAVEYARDIVPHGAVAIAEACLNLGGVSVIRQEFERASKQFQTACQECQNGGHREKRVLAHGYQLLGDTEFRCGRFQSAVEQVSL